MKLSTVFLTLNNRDANWQLQNFLKDLIFMPFEKMTERVTPPVPAVVLSASRSPDSQRDADVTRSAIFQTVT